MGDFPDPYEKVSWRGGRCDRIDKVAFEVLEDKVNATTTIYQLGYNPGGVGASGGTHDGGGAYDYLFPTISDVMEQIRPARAIGLDAWPRFPPTFPRHNHAIRHHSKTASPTAKEQMGNYVVKGDGLWPLVAGDDPNPWRPDPIASFTVEDYRNELARRAREDRLRDRVRRLARNIKHLARRKRKARRQLKKLH